ncbi:GntR family transcriptional regulator [Arvimicrobium flavum]|uniref:GntR family transcriptional regulator n=1 Tax=Arvimicrobium flavum TaxID=3393320 RepID=UPI00237A5A29|nr:GntR family transcriptional regulator [Mesorhizobium shangrilense]
MDETQDTETQSMAQKGRVHRRALSAVFGDGSRPLYKEVKLALTRLLSSGDVGPGEAIPTEKQLCEQFGVSIGTIRKAIDELVAERVLVRQQGRGTFLVSHTPERMLNRFWRIVGRNGAREIPIVQTLTFKRSVADDAIAAALGIAKGDAVFSIVNLQLLGGAPVVLDEIILPHAAFPNLTEQGLRTRDTTMYGYYQEAFGVNIINVFDKLSAIKADKFVAEHLSVKVGEPILKVQRIACTFDNQPVELRYSQIQTENYEYHNTMGMQST